MPSNKSRPPPLPGALRPAAFDWDSHALFDLARHDRALATTMEAAADSECNLAFRLEIRSRFNVSRRRQRDPRAALAVQARVSFQRFAAAAAARPARGSRRPGACRSEFLRFIAYATHTRVSARALRFSRSSAHVICCLIIGIFLISFFNLFFFCFFLFTYFFLFLIFRLKSMPNNSIKCTRIQACIAQI